MEIIFAALAHQLFFVKLNSALSMRSFRGPSEKILSNIGIKQNFDLFSHDLKNRIYELKNEIKNIETECHFFLNHCLSQFGFWGGTESLKAISSLHNVNIIIFNENGPYYFSNVFDPSYERTISIAFRASNKFNKKNQNNSNRNHYDTIVEMEDEVIVEISKGLMRQVQCKTTKCDTVINLDETQQ